MSFSGFSKFALGSLLVALGVDAGTPASCTNTQISCQNTTAVTDSCCFNAPGGQLLLTQFWDTDPVTGPVDSWTLHGLWPDNCDGTYDANCDSTRAYTDIPGILTAAGKTSLLRYMQTYWKDNQGDDESFWEHEWSKHGTCINTIKPSCYTGYTSKEELVDYFEVAVQLFKGLDTYKALAAAGITPSTSKTYTSAKIQAALKAATGHTVTLGCSNGTLKEVWYHFNVKGSVPAGEFIATEPDGVKSTCATSGVKYLPKSGTKTSPSSPTGL
uniref:ribonuclease T2 n=1 Tax=Morchella esculenta TaxID=39407 RepID=F5HPQ8_9PEZI|nr:ribonuclease T2 [Morchella esculenta]BAK32789.1 ribonuclease T2 [Morchella esculenta]